MADIYTAPPLFTGETAKAGEPPMDWFDWTYRRLGFRVIEEFMSDHENPTRFKWTYHKDDKTADDYWRKFRVCQRELESSIDGLELWWTVWMGDGKPWEEVKRGLEVAIR